MRAGMVHVAAMVATGVIVAGVILLTMTHTNITHATLVLHEPPELLSQDQLVLHVPSGIRHEPSNTRALPKAPCRAKPCRACCSRAGDGRECGQRRHTRSAEPRAIAPDGGPLCARGMARGGEEAGDWITRRRGGGGFDPASDCQSVVRE